MALTRINPLHDLKQTARDLAVFITFSEQQELLNCLKEAKEIYQRPLNSWSTGFIYYLLGTRNRFSAIDKAMEQVFRFCDDSESNQSGLVIDLFEKGGWEETSFNTTLIRVMVRHLRDYDDTVKLPLSVVTELKALLAFEQARLLNEDQISKQQTVIDALKVKKIEMQNALRELARQLQEGETKQKELDQLQEKMQELDAERKQQEALLAEKKLLTLTNVDMTALSDEQKQEAMQIAETAIRMYLQDLKEQRNQKADMSTVTSGRASAAKHQLERISVFQVDPVKRQNASSEITQSAPGANKDFKHQLATLLGGQVASKAAQNILTDAKVEKAKWEKVKAEKTEKAKMEKAKTELATVIVVQDYLPGSADTVVAQAKVELSAVVVTSATPATLPKKIENSQFANIKQNLATFFAHHPAVQRVVDAAKPAPSDAVSLGK